MSRNESGLSGESLSHYEKMPTLIRFISQHLSALWTCAAICAELNLVIFSPSPAAPYYPAAPFSCCDVYFCLLTAINASDIIRHRIHSDLQLRRTGRQLKKGISREHSCRYVITENMLSAWSVASCTDQWLLLGSSHFSSRCFSAEL